MIRETTRTRALYGHERRWFYALTSCLAIVVFLYMYFLSASVLHVVVRSEVDNEISALSSDISEFESQYIEMQHAVSESIATLHGFKKAETKVFIEREKSLTLSTF